MKYLLIPKKINSCSACEYEGDMDLYLPEHDVELNCYFVGNVDSMRQSFPIDEECEADISFSFGKAKETSKRTKSIHPKLVGIYSSKELDEDGDTLYLIDSIFTVEMDNELDCYNEPAEIGTWVECTGEFVIEEL